MVKNGIRTGVVLPGGWHFPQPLNTGGTFLIKEQTYERLEDAVFTFRLAHMEIIASGSATRENVQLDIYHFVCRNFPGNCATNDYRPPVAVPERAEQRTEYNSPIVRVEDWLRSISNQELKWTSAADAQFRSEICAGCPQNIQWTVKCLPCNDAITRRILRLKGSKTTTKDDSLRACRCFGHHNELAVWLNQPGSKPQTDPPNHCWMKG